MIGSLLKTAVVAAMGLVLLVGQGCSMKWLQSDGETGAGSAQNGANPNYPGGSGGGLSGFSQNPWKSAWERVVISHRFLPPG